MQLTNTQKDALNGVINLGCDRAASALSELTGHRIHLEVPEIRMHPFEEIGPLIGRAVEGEVASVHQMLSGLDSGNALLLLDEKAALMLSELLTNEVSASGSLDAGAREIITEIGNIVLNACLGVLGNLLHVPISFAEPRLRVDAVDSVLQSIALRNGELNFALLIPTRFHLRTRDVTGYLLIILGLRSLDRVLSALEKRGNAGNRHAPQ